MGESRPTKEGKFNTSTCCKHCGKTIWISNWGTYVKCCHCGYTAN